MGRRRPPVGETVVLLGREGVTYRSGVGSPRRVGSPCVTGSMYHCESLRCRGDGNGVANALRYSSQLPSTLDESKLPHLSYIGDHILVSELKTRRVPLDKASFVVVSRNPRLSSLVST